MKVAKTFYERSRVCLDIRISFSELHRGQIPSYENGDTITIFSEGNIAVSELSELRVIFPVSVSLII